MSNKEIKIESDITVSSIDNLHRIVDDLLENGVVNITMDFSSVNVIDSTGIGFLIRVQNSLKEKNGVLSLKNVNDDIEKMIKIMRLDNHFKLLS